jgi:hypothetical protein
MEIRDHSIDQLGSLNTARPDDKTGEYMLIEACKLSHSCGGTRMPEVLHVQCTGVGIVDGACWEGAGKGVHRAGGAWI